MRPLATSAIARLILTLVLTCSVVACSSSTPPKDAAAGAPEAATETATDDGPPAMQTGRMTEGAAAAEQRKRDAIREAEEEAMRIEAAKNAPPVDPNAAPAEAAAGDGAPLAAFPDRESIDPTNKYGVMQTTGGDIWFYFYPEDAPLHVKNFIYLATKDFYRDVKFHRIVPGFVIQGGEARPDWTEPQVAIKLEANKTRIHIPGALAAARTDDPNSATSQFYFCITREQTAQLDGGYTVYGQAFRGMDAINAIGTSEANSATAKVLGCQIFEMTPEIAEEIKTYKANHSIPE